MRGCRELCTPEALLKVGVLQTDLRFLVLDEADKMLGEHFLVSVQSIIEFTLDRRCIDPELREGLSARYSDEELREGFPTKWDVQGTPNEWILDWKRVSRQGSTKAGLMSTRACHTVPCFC